VYTLSWYNRWKDSHTNHIWWGRCSKYFPLSWWHNLYCRGLYSKYNHNMQISLQQVGELLPIHSNNSLSFLTCRQIYTTCIRSVILHWALCDALLKKDCSFLIQNDKVMFRWICGAKVHDSVSSDIPCKRLGIPDLELNGKTDCTGLVMWQEQWLD